MPAEVLGWSTLALRMGAAIVAGGAIGLDRRRSGAPAGLRTHMLVSLGSCVVVLVPLAMGAGADAVSRGIQGIATGVGFLGAGEILHHVRGDEDKDRVKGLTSAASVWLTAGLGLAAGCGLWKTVALAAAGAILILTIMKPIEDAIFGRDKPDKRADGGS